LETGEYQFEIVRNDLLVRVNETRILSIAHVPQINGETAQSIARTKAAGWSAMKPAASPPH
jgi:hypothetical protein